MYLHEPEIAHYQHNCRGDMYITETYSYSFSCVSWNFIFCLLYLYQQYNINEKIVLHIIPKSCMGTRHMIKWPKYINHREQMFNNCVLQVYFPFTTHMLNHLSYWFENKWRKINTESLHHFVLRQKPIDRAILLFQSLKTHKRYPKQRLLACTRVFECTLSLNLQYSHFQ